MTFKKRAARYVALAFFAVYFSVGVSVYDDYGVPWDEPIQQKYAEAVWDYAAGYIKGEDLAQFQDLRRYLGPGFELFRAKYYGPAFEILQMAVQKALGPADTRALLLTRHMVNFGVSFIGMVFFFLLLMRLLENPWLSVLGCFFMALSPRIFAHSFYNPKDIVFMSLSIVSIYTLFLYLERPSALRTVLHALSSALLLDIRIVGVFVPLLTVFFVALGLALNNPSRRYARRPVLSLLVYLALWFLLVVLFWPTLWNAPLENLLSAFRTMSGFPWLHEVKYMGEFIKASSVPWHYSTVWIGITTPLTYVLLFCIGTIAALGLVLKKPLALDPQRRGVLIMLMWSFVPLAGVAALGSTLYDGWRQMFFVYPPMLAIALLGLRAVARFLTKRPPRRWAIALGLVAFAAMLLDISGVASFMVRNHPHQYVYFNPLSGGMQAARENFETDYWGLSYRQGLEYILANTDAPEVRVYADNPPGMYNAYILPPEEKKRLVFTQKEDADYFISNLRWRQGRYAPRGMEYYSLQVDGAEILVVYRGNRLIRYLFKLHGT